MKRDMTVRLRHLMLAFSLLSALVTPGCRCIKTPASMRASEEMRRQIQKDLETRETAAAASPSPGAAASSFDTQDRLDAMRDGFAQQRWDSVRHDGLALVTAPLDDVTKLEVLMMLADAFRQSGDAERAREFNERFRKLYDEVRASDKMGKEGRDRTTLLNTLARFKRRASTDVFADPDGESRPSFKMAEKLRGSSPDEVLTDQLADGTAIHFSKNPDALESKVSRLPIQRDPEFDYYFAIQEAPPPSPAPGKK